MQFTFSLRFGNRFDVDDGERFQGGMEHQIAAPIEKIPVFQRGGTVIPRQMRLRRSSALMGADPYTLVVAPDLNGTAKGTLFLDAGDGYNYRSGEHQYMSYLFSDNTLRVSKLSGGGFDAPNVLERIEIFAVAEPSKVLLRQPSGEVELSSTMNFETNRLVIRKPGVKMVADDWEIVLK